MRWLLTLSLVSILAVACVGTAPTPAHTPAPTVDVGATVEAAVEATRTVERAVEATVSARVEATRAAAPTSTPVVMTTYAPTPEPYVAAPGSMEQGIEEFYKCLRDSEEFRALLLTVMGEDGLSREGVSSLLDLLIAEKELFTELMLEAVEEDPEFASMLSLLGVMAGELCGPVVQESAGDLGDEPG